MQNVQKHIFKHEQITFSEKELLITLEQVIAQKIYEFK